MAYNPSSSLFQYPGRHQASPGPPRPSRPPSRIVLYVVQKPEGISSLPFMVAERRPIAADAGKTGLCGRALSGDADLGLYFALRETHNDTTRQRQLPDVRSSPKTTAASRYR